MGPMVEDGKKDAKAAVEAGPGVNFEEFNHWYHSKFLERKQNVNLSDLFKK